MGGQFKGFSKVMLTLPDLSPKALELGHHTGSDYTALRIALAPQPPGELGHTAGWLPKASEDMWGLEGVRKAVQGTGYTHSMFSVFPHSLTCGYGQDGCPQRASP